MQLPVTLPPHSEPEPDFAIVKIDATLYRDRPPGPSDIYFIIEVADSTLQKDRQYKSELYAQASIPEYWIINLQNNQVIIYRQLQDNCYQTEQIFKASDKVQPLAFPALTVDLKKLLILTG
ncbi:Uma2 family endonuclease [Leptothoe kymatousa]|uniref:Uma2 family endonuclease n=1 Tax=Leptothoe kymatousa TaxID=2651727 RepID=UPI001C01B73B|nr:Uma2 family endonuclease [Leptothoe kymatousa]